MFIKDLDSLKIVQHPKTQTTVYGDRAKLSLLAVGPRPLTYQWLKDGIPVMEIHPPNFTGVNSSTLEINPFLPAHVGSYQCIVSHVPSNKKAETNAASLHLGMFLLKILFTHLVHVQYLNRWRDS
jgi:hypothetical protein